MCAVYPVYVYQCIAVNAFVVVFVAIAAVNVTAAVTAAVSLLMHNDFGIHSTGEQNQNKSYYTTH